MSDETVTSTTSTTSTTPTVPEPKSPTERLTHLESLAEGIVRGYMGFYREINDLKSRLVKTEQVLGEAMQFVYGVERCFLDGKTVDKDTLRESILNNRIDSMKAEVTKHITDGLLKSAEVTTDQSFIVFRDIAVDGTVLDPRNQIVVSNVKGELKEKFLGKKVGDLVSVLPDRNIEILEVYEIVPPPPPEIAASPAVSEPPKEGESNAKNEEPTA